jgi:Fic family protein
MVTDPDLLAEQEARNGLEQFDLVMEMVEYHLHPERPFRFRPSHLLDLHRTALKGISSYAGNYRPANIEIGGSKHQPVGAHQVPEKVEGLCDYINENWISRKAIHLSAYVLWRLNWIHPFTDGNGRTSRAASYLILCLRLGYPLPGKKTIPDQISENKNPYYIALEKADAEWEKGIIDLSGLEEMIKAMLARQLVAVHEEATGEKADFTPGEAGRTGPL